MPQTLEQVIQFVAKQARCKPEQIKVTPDKDDPDYFFLYDVYGFEWEVLLSEATPTLTGGSHGSMDIDETFRIFPWLQDLMDECARRWKYKDFDNKEYEVDISDLRGCTDKQVEEIYTWLRQYRLDHPDNVLPNVCGNGFESENWHMFNDLLEELGFFPDGFHDEEGDMIKQIMGSMPLQILPPTE